VNHISNSAFKWLLRVVFGLLTISIAACGDGVNSESSATPPKPLSPEFPAHKIVDLSSDYAPEVIALIKISERKVSDTIIEYVFRVVIQARDIDLYGVAGSVSAVGRGSSVVESTIEIRKVGRLSDITSDDTITIHHDTRIPFTDADWTWSFKAFKPIPPVAAVFSTITTDFGEEIASGEVVAYAAENATHPNIVALIETVGGEVVGHSAIQRTYQIRFPGVLSFAELESKRVAIASSALIAGASFNGIVRPMNRYDVSDPVTRFDANHIHNWPYHAINVYDAWQQVYGGKSDEQIRPVTVGIVDLWFADEERGLQVVGAQPWPFALFGGDPSHGNFVAGIIGATADDFLTAGIVHRQSTLIGFASIRRDFFGPFVGLRSEVTNVTVLSNLEKAVLDGVPVINISVGSGYISTITNCDIASIYRLMQAGGWKSLIVQAAGNGKARGRVADGNSSLLGFASRLGRTDDDFDDDCELNGISIADAAAAIRNHTIVVGAFDADAAFSLATDALVIPSYSVSPAVPGKINAQDNGRIDLSEFFHIYLPQGAAIMV